MTDSFWKIDSINLNEVSFRLSLIAQSFLWQLFKNRVMHCLGKDTGYGLRSIEIGCGLGKFSLLMGMWGFRPTLLDSNASALNHAKALFDEFEIQCDCLQADALELPEGVLDKFDVSTSFGLAEHFYDWKRDKILRNHVKVLKPFGFCFFQVPNALSPFYRFAFGIRKLMGLWPSNIPEIPFTSLELKSFARRYNLQNILILSTQSLWIDFDYWILNNLRSMLKKGGIYEFPQKKKRLVSPEELRSLINREISFDLSVFDRAFSYPLLLTGTRNPKAI